MHPHPNNTALPSSNSGELLLLPEAKVTASLNSTAHPLVRLLYSTVRHPAHHQVNMVRLNNSTAHLLLSSTVANRTVPLLAHPLSRPTALPRPTPMALLLSSMVPSQLMALLLPHKEWAEDRDSLASLSRLHLLLSRRRICPDTTLNSTLSDLGKPPR